MNSKFILIILCCLLLSCSKNQQLEQNIIIVKVPPIYDEKLSPEEKHRRFQHFLFPQIVTPNPIPKGLTNDDSFLFLSVDENGKVKLNSQDIGGVSKTDSLKLRLAQIFIERVKEWNV